jgi:Domain of unknown function (DUF4388)
VDLSQLERRRRITIVALEGTLKDFSLADILQLIGLQRKTGVLTIEGEDDTVTISFLDGKVVASDSTARRLENRLGNLLFKANKISSEQLAHVLEMQKSTLQRLGFLLIKERMVTPEDLREALRLQILRIIYRLFRWKDGRYHFTQELIVDYDTDHLSPISTDQILMEAARMTDEWPILQERVRSLFAVYRRSDSHERDTLADEENGPPPPGAIAVTYPELTVWPWIDGTRTVAEVIDSTFLSDFDVVKGIYDLIERGLIEEVRTEVPALPQRRPPASSAEPTRDAGHTARLAALWIAIVLLLGVSVNLMRSNEANLFLRPVSSVPERASFWKAVSMIRLSRIDRAISVFYELKGRYPDHLTDLVVAGILRPIHLLDPFGQPYRYIPRPDEKRYQLYAWTAGGRIDPDLSLSRGTSPTAEEANAPKPVPSKDKKQVIIVE